MASLKFKVHFDRERAEKIMAGFEERLAECITVSACDDTDETVSVGAGGCAPPVHVSASEPEWITWHGAPRPPLFSPTTAEFQVLFRRGNESTWWPVAKAGNLDWTRDNLVGDIVAYRVRGRQ